MNISIPLIAKKTASHLGYLNYRKIDLTKTQQRLADRYALEPEISFADLTCSAVIDWIKLRFYLSRETQHQWIRQYLMEMLELDMFVEAVDRGLGNESDTFDITFQEPRPADITAVRRALDHKYKLLLEDTVAGIEISVDFTPKRPDDVLRAKTYVILTRHFVTATDLFTNFSDRPRFTYGHEPHDTEAAIFGRRRKHSINEESLKSTDRDRAPYIDSTYSFGAKAADRRWRIMDKIIDRQNPAAGTLLRLDDSSKRVRIEVTLEGNELTMLGIAHVGDLKSLSFSQLQGKFFKFMLPTFAKTADKMPSRSVAMQTWRDRQRLAKFLNTGVFGLKAMDEAAARQSKAIRRDERKSWRAHGLMLKPMKRVGTGRFGTLVSYDALNERVETALRHLGERVRAGDF